MQSEDIEVRGGVTRKQVLTGAAAGLLAALMGFKSAWAAGKALKAGLVMPNYDQLRWKNADQAFFEKQAKEEGIQVLVQVSNTSEALQESQVENLR